MSDVPRTWTELMRRLAFVFGGYEGQPYAAAEHWVMEACEVTWGQPLHELSRTRRQIAFQKACGTLIALEDQGELMLQRGLRGIVQRQFARFWQGAALHGPPWRLDPYEDKPLYDAWAASADF